MRTRSFYLGAAEKLPNKFNALGKSKSVMETIPNQNPVERNRKMVRVHLRTR